MKSNAPTNLEGIPLLYSNIAISVFILSLSTLLFKHLRLRSPNETTRLNGPRNKSFLFGLNKHINEAEDLDIIYEEWVSKYGPAFRVPGSLGSSRIAICDPKAIAHLYSKDGFDYTHAKQTRVFIEILFGRGILWAEGESHRRQRKALSPAFNNATIRKLTPVIYDAAYKMKSMWDSTLDAGHGEAVIDVQLWMGRVALDTIGLAGFGRDFQSLEGQRPPVIEALESLGSGATSSISKLLFLLGPALPMLQKLPTKNSQMLKQMKATLELMAVDLLARNRKEIDASSLAEEKSIIGLIVKAETADSSLGMSKEEVLAQMNTLLIAGFETTSISLTWALIELARNPEKQQKLRDELGQFIGCDPTFDQLSASLPYLESVTQEVLRLHPPVGEVSRTAAKDDIMPFSHPITMASGKMASSLIIKKGTEVTSPIRYMNRAEAFWGPNAKEFVPERWLEDDSCPGAKEIQGHRHILTFLDGPKMCLGRNFALAELKAVLSVLVRNYMFEFPDGPSTVIGKHVSILPQPKVAGQIGPRVPLIIRRVD